MATTTRLVATLLEEAQAGKIESINAALQIIDAAVAILTAANTFSAANVFSGSLQHTGSQAGFFNHALVSQQANTVDLSDVLTNLGFRASGGAPPLNLNGGLLSVGSARLAGNLGGSGATAFSWKRFALTFPSDADYTLLTGEADCPIIDVQTTGITATRNIIVPGTTGAVYWVINRNAQSVVLKTSGGTGITIPTTRARLIAFPTGVNAFALSASQDYTT